MSISPMISPNFKKSNLDTEVLENMNAITPSDELSKALKKEGLVQKDVTVQGKNGTYTRKQWVRASEATSGDQKSAKQQEEPKDGKTATDNKKPAISFEKQEGKTGKQSLAEMLSSGTSRVDIMTAAKEQGISWKENDHEGINWMRASMAIQKHMDNGGSAQSQDKITDKAAEQPKQENKQKSSVDNSKGKLQVGQTVYCDQIGNGKSKVTVTGLDGENGKITVKNGRGSEYDVPMSSLYSSKEDAENGENSIADSGSDKQESKNVSGTSLSFEKKEALGLGNPVYKLSNGDEVSPHMPAATRGENIKNLDKTSDMDEHFTEDFTTKGVGGKTYTVTREVTIYNKDAKVKGGRFQSKVTSIVEQSAGGKSEKPQSVIGKDYTKLTTEDEADSIEGQAHNMIVGYLKADGKKNPSESDVKGAARSLAEQYTKRDLVYGGENKKLSDHFHKLAGVDRNQTLKDIAQESYGKPDQRSQAIKELLGKEYRVTPRNTVETTADVGGKYLAEVKISPKFGGRWSAEFVYPDGVSRKETYDSVKSVQEASDKFIKDQKSKK